MSNKNKVTIQKVPDTTAEYLRSNGVTSEGNKLLKGGEILRVSGILDHLIMMYDKNMHEQVGMLEMIEKAVSIGRIINGSVIEPVSVASAAAVEAVEEEDDEPPAFGA